MLPDQCKPNATSVSHASSLLLRLLPRLLLLLLCCWVLAVALRHQVGNDLHDAGPVRLPVRVTVTAQLQLAAVGVVALAAHQRYVLQRRVCKQESGRGRAAVSAAGSFHSTTAAAA